MAYKFGGATTDDINITMAAGVGGNTSMSLQMGWFYPTTLTNGRYYYSFGNTVGLGVAATTSELTWTTANATTGGVWTSTTAGITTNKWHFIAVLATHNNTGPAMAVQCWVYDDVNGWRDATMAQTTAPVGNFTAGTACTIGNRGTGSVAFQGDIDSFVALTAGTPTGRGVLPVVTAGALTQNAKDKIFTDIVVPCAYGTLDFQRLITSAWSSTFEIATFHFYGGAWTHRWAATSLTISMTTVATVNGAALSSTRAPNVIPQNWQIGNKAALR